MIPFLAELIASTPGDQLIDRLTHTPFDALLIINLADDTYEDRYHADSKFFTPALAGSFRQLLKYASVNMVHPDDREIHLRLMDPDTMAERLAQASPKGILSETIRYLALDGNWRHMQHLLVSGSIRGESEKIIYFYLFDTLDMRYREEGQHTDSAASAERLRGMMPNLLTETTFFALAQERMHHLSGQWCMVAVDVKHFKLFRELNGQDKGDRLLISFAEHLYETAEETGGLACYRGQDDYGLLIPFDQERINRLFNDLCAEIDQLSGTSGFFPIFGICIIYETDSPALDLFNRAALTAEEIKDDLQLHMRIYDPDTHERHVEEFKLLAEFKEALSGGRITFFLQPQVNVETGRIVAAESLARWRREDGSYIPPTLFVPVLEKYGVVSDLDSFLWDRTCAWLRSAIDKGISPVPISVNISRINIFSMDVPAFLSELTAKYRLDPALIEVEITESAYVDDEEKMRNTVSELQCRGFRVLMDDFGSGYSSLNMLRNISVDIIKLDAQFLHLSLGEEQKGINILESVINMTRSLSTPIIVEGVETPALVRYLKDMGCRYMQGFHYYRPMPAEQFESLIALPGNVDRKGIILLRNEQVHTREFLDDSIYSEAMLNNILGPVAFYSMKDSNVDIIRYNQQFARMAEMEPDQLEERRYHIQQHVYSEDLDRFTEMFQAAVRDRINGAEGLIRFYTPKGSLFWIQLHVYYLRNENGKSIFYGTNRNVTELQYLSGDLPGGYYRCAVTDKYEFLYVSQGFLDMLGYTREELKSLYNDEFVRMLHPDDVAFVKDESDHTILREHVDYTPFRVRHKNGNYLYVVEQSQLTDRFGGLSWQSIIIDITEVMTLRNRMRLLAKYSTDCIVFIHDLMDPASVEIAVYGLDELLGMDQETFRKELVSREMKILNRNGEELYEHLVTEYDNSAQLNGAYTLIFTNGKSVKMHMRFNRIFDASQNVECIVSFSPATM